MVDLSTAASVPYAPDGRFADLAACLTGRIHLPGTARYTELATPWNVAVPNTPVAVVEVHSAADVAATVVHARRAGLRVSAQATGHGAAAYAEPVLQISTTAMDEFSISSAGTVRCGPGVVWTQIIERAAPLGFAGLTGSAPGVGVVGFLTGGGVGPLARSYGLSADYVTAFDVVTGDGLLRRATTTENPDLFWGLRGGKGALGIVTGVEFDLVPATELLGGCLYFDGADVPAVLQAWRDWSVNLPEEANSSVAILRLPPLPMVPAPLAGTITVAVRFAWVGDVAEGRRVWAGMAGAGRQIFGGVDIMSHSDIGRIHNDPDDPMPAYESSILLQDLTAESVDAVLALAGPGSECPQVIVELRHLGGAISRAPQDACAFSHRSAACADHHRVGCTADRGRCSRSRGGAADRRGAVERRKLLAEFFRVDRTRRSGPQVRSGHPRPARDAVDNVRPGRRDGICRAGPGRGWHRGRCGPPGR